MVSSYSNCLNPRQRALQKQEALANAVCSQGVWRAVPLLKTPDAIGRHTPTKKITTGQGEYVVFSRGNQVVSEEIFQKVYSIFQEHTPIKLVNAGKSEEEVAERYKTLIRQGQSNRSES